MASEPSPEQTTTSNNDELEVSQSPVEDKMVEEENNMNESSSEVQDSDDALLSEAEAEASENENQEKKSIAEKEKEKEEEEKLEVEEQKEEAMEAPNMSPNKSNDACSTSSGNSSGSLGIPEGIEEVEDDDEDELQEEEDQGEEEEEEEEEGDFCGEMASNFTLRKIKQDTEEDLSVCEQNRQSLEAARRLFGDLERQHHEDQTGSLIMKQHQQQKQKQKQTNGRRSAPPIVLQTARKGSLGSSSNSSSSRDGGSILEDEVDYDVKIVRRSGSSASSCRSNYRQTLVCSVSPTRQLGASAGAGAGSGNGCSNSTSDLSHHSTADLSQPVYPIEGEEMRQCREAFRENLRLIQEQQARGAANNNKNYLLGSQPLGDSGLLSSSGGNGNGNGNGNGDSSRSDRVQSILLQRQHWSLCSRCQKRVYPLDQLELDFTRTTLQIHRNCFKCQICSSLLRLETYAAMDAKLYCPAHIKCANSGNPVQSQQQQQ